MKIRKLSIRELVIAVLNTVKYSNERLDDSLPAVKRISVSFKRKLLKSCTENDDLSGLSDDYAIFTYKKNKRLVIELIYKKKER